MPTHHPAALIRELEAAARLDDFAVEAFGCREAWPLLALTRKGGPNNSGRRIYLSAGIHGDEPAGVLALLDLLRSAALPRQLDYFIFPLLNPSGLDAGTRENHEGLDLNRDYREPQSIEVRQHIRWIEAAIGGLDLSLLLHEDWESQGFYLYELNFSTQPGLAEAILRAAGQWLPIETATQIDGHPAARGRIRPESLPEVEAGEPEAIFLQKRFGGLNYTLETPSALPLADRIGAHKAAVLAALAGIAL